MTPTVPSDCPIADARTRILERRQTEDGFGRNFYLVEITYLGGQEPTSTWVQSSDNSDSYEKGGTEVARVDVSRILHYVSPRELERFENEQFRIEAEAQAVADREEAEEQTRRRLAKNARVAGSGRGRGRGRGSRMLDGRGIDPELQTASMRGTPRGRGRGRGRRRGGWRGRGGLVPPRRELPQDEIVDSEPSQTLPTSRDDIAEASSESDDELPEPASPNLMRSAFVANSALSLSPAQPHRPLPPPARRRGHPEVPDIGDTDTIPEDGSMSSAAIQLRFEGDYGDIAIAESPSVGSELERGHRSKRRRTESVEPQHTLMFPPSSQIEESESEVGSIPPEPPSTVRAHKSHDASLDHHMTPRDIDASQHDGEDEDEDAEDYVVEAIIGHYYDEGGRKFYLVKWEGYEDSHDWLPEEDLEGAAQLMQDYNERLSRRTRTGSAP